MNTSRLESCTEEIIGLEDLKQNLLDNTMLRHYIGFEISGLVHLGTGLMSGIVVRELQKLGVETSYFLADWHTWINNKLGGDMKLINKVALEYFGPALRISAKIAGASEEDIKLNYGTEVYHNNDHYWKSLVEISKNLTVARVTKSTTILGRAESNSMPFAFLLYPPMQVADIFEMQCNIAHSGTDQRKVHVIAREVSDKLKISPLVNALGNTVKPIAIHHHLLLGLQKPSVWPIPKGVEKEFIRTEMKMSKSISGSAIFIHDSEEEVRSKVRKAFCPEKEIEINPILDWAKHIIFPIVGELYIKRDVRFGGSFTASTYQELEEKYTSGDLFSLDLKNAVAEALIDLLAPAREYFKSEKLINLINIIKESQTR